MKLKKRVTNNSISNQVYTLLKENIINLSIAPGTSISEKEIAEQLEVSRTPVREAFVRLVQDELLEIYPQKGTIVSLINPKDVQDAHFIREHLEKATFKLACQNIAPVEIDVLKLNIRRQQESISEQSFHDFFRYDEEFHRVIVEVSGNKKVWNTIQRINAHLNRIRFLSLMDERKFQLIIQEHEDIVTALEKKDEKKLITIFEKHISHLMEDIENLAQLYPEHFQQSKRH